MPMYMLGRSLVGQGILTRSAGVAVGAAPTLVMGGEFSDLKTEGLAGDLVLLLCTAQFVKGATAGASVLSISPVLAGPNVTFWDNVTGSVSQLGQAYQVASQVSNLFLFAVVNWNQDGYQYWNVIASSAGSNATVSGVALTAWIFR